MIVVTKDVDSEIIEGLRAKLEHENFFKKRVT